MGCNLCKGNCGNPHNLVGNCDRYRQDSNRNNTVLIDTVHNAANDMFSNLELDFAYPRMITDVTNVNINSHDNISSTTSVSVPINEGDHTDQRSDSSSDESSGEFIGRPLLSCPPMNENDLTYGDDMY